MKNLWTIVKKEFARFFKDRRLMLSLILPGILIYIVYSVLGGGVFEKIGQVDEDYVYKVYTVNAPENLAAELMLDEELFSLTEIGKENIAETQKSIEDQTADLLVVFPENFSFQTATAESVINTYYNSVKTESSAAYTEFSARLSTKQFDAPKFLALPSDLASEKDVAGMIFSMIGPMLVLVFLFAGCTSIAPESIAGEKERGTLATMLVTPVKRSHIAIGKIIALSTLSLISGACSFLGLMLSLPKLMGDMDGLSVDVYGVGDFAMLFGIIISSVLLIVALISVISAFAKSVKEAAGMVGPLMIAVMVMGILTMFVSETNAWYWYLVPLYNSALSMSCIFSFAVSPLNVLLTIGVNILGAVALSFALAKMFDSEKIMFQK